MSVGPTAVILAGEEHNFHILLENSRLQCHPVPIMGGIRTRRQISQPKFKHTETLFTNRAICIPTWQKKWRKNSALTPGNHYRNERQKRLKRCDGGKRKEIHTSTLGLANVSDPSKHKQFN